MVPFWSADAQPYIPDDGGTWVLVEEDSPFCDLVPYAPVAADNALGIAVVMIAIVGTGAMIAFGGDARA